MKHKIYIQLYFQPNRKLHFWEMVILNLPIKALILHIYIRKIFMGLYWGSKRWVRTIAASIFCLPCSFGQIGVQLEDHPIKNTAEIKHVWIKNTRIRLSIIDRHQRSLFIDLSYPIKFCINFCRLSLSPSGYFWNFEKSGFRIPKNQLRNHQVWIDTIFGNITFSSKALFESPTQI